MSRGFSMLVRLVGVVVFLLGVALSLNAFSYLNFDFSYGFLRLKQQAIATGWYLPAYYAHVLVAALILIIGFLQLHPTLGRKWMPIHRLLGKIYIFGILFFAAPGGLVMSFYINRGPWVLLSFTIQCLLWFYFTAMAYDRIRKKDVASHRAFMWRSFALTFAAITLRIYVFFSSWSFDLTQPVAYATIAWLSWLPNLLIVELYLKLKTQKLNF
jgi:hypothetical protein